MGSFGVVRAVPVMTQGGIAVRAEHTEAGREVMANQPPRNLASCNLAVLLSAAVNVVYTKKFVSRLSAARACGTVMGKALFALGPMVISDPLKASGLIRVVPLKAALAVSRHKRFIFRENGFVSLSGARQHAVDALGAHPILAPLLFIEAVSR